MRPYLYYENAYNGKTASLHWDGPLFEMSIFVSDFMTLQWYVFLVGVLVFFFFFTKEEQAALLADDGNH